MIKINGNGNKIIIPAIQGNETIQKCMEDLIEKSLEHIDNTSIDMPTTDNCIESDVVVIYDETGVPNIMRRFKKQTNKELFGGSEKTHPAFIIGGEEYDEIYISVYPNTMINGKPYSLPLATPATSITIDEAAEACRKKGDGWHLLTAAEWGLLANISYKNNTLPHGNTENGKYHTDPSESGIICENGKTLTGSGPTTWTHNHKPDGVHDLCGNVYEFVNGLRLYDGQLQAIANNNAAFTDNTREYSWLWQPIKDNTNNAIYVSVGSEIALTTTEDIERDFDGCDWDKVKIECESEALKELAIYNGEPNSLFSADSTTGEYIPLRGGGWDATAGAGVFNLSLDDPRSASHSYVGFRSAYFKKN